MYIYGRPVDGEWNKIIPSAVIARKMRLIDGNLYVFVTGPPRFTTEIAPVSFRYFRQKTRVSLLNGFAFYASYDICILLLLRIYGVNIHTFTHVQICLVHEYTRTGREYLVRLYCIIRCGVLSTL